MGTGVTLLSDLWQILILKFTDILTDSLCPQQDPLGQGPLADTDTEVYRHLNGQPLSSCQDPLALSTMGAYSLYLSIR